MKKKIKFLILLFLVSTVWCYGYIDPGTGSYLVQIIIATVVGVSLGVKIFWKKIKGFLAHFFSKGGTPTDRGE
jgi:hypothetical protein